MVVSGVVVVVVVVVVTTGVGGNAGVGVGIPCETFSPVISNEYVFQTLVGLMTKT